MLATAALTHTQCVRNFIREKCTNEIFRRFTDPLKNSNAQHIWRVKCHLISKVIRGQGHPRSRSSEVKCYNNLIKRLIEITFYLLFTVFKKKRVVSHRTYDTNVIKINMMKIASSATQLDRFKKERSMYASNGVLLAMSSTNDCSVKSHCREIGKLR